MVMDLSIEDFDKWLSEMDMDDLDIIKEHLKKRYFELNP
jgi:hypothetical protein